MTTTASPSSRLPLIVRLLLETGHLGQEDLETIREARLQDDVSTEELLIRKGLANERDIAVAYSEYFLLPLVEPPEDGVRVDPQLAQILPEKLCRNHLLVPIAADTETLDVAFFRPDELLLVDELQLLTGLRVRPQVATLSTVEGVLGTLYEDSAWLAPGSHGDLSSFEAVDDGPTKDGPGEVMAEEVMHLDQPPPPGRDGRIIRYVNHMLEQAFRTGASDIHIEPFEDRCRVRLRIDGNLTEIAPPPWSLYAPIVSRIKVLAKMDIAEKRMPQDGAIAMKSGDRRVDVRVSTIPTIRNEKVVLRVLDKSAIPLELSGLGLDERQSTDLLESIQTPHGLMLVTGPTGSGKSTTLYTCLNRLNEPHKNICTVEDPVEYKFPGMNQIHVRTQIGLDFASALRSILRQDPDIIMVGEVRDSETAQICLRAALTGHFVLSTLHTNDALAAVNRLQDMGIEPFLLATTIRMLVAQRLIRRLCQKCRQPYACDRETAQRFAMQVGETLFRPKGCNECRETGYRGRVGVFEAIRITNRMANLIQARTPLSDLRRAATEQGMKPLADSALEKVRQGITSLAEALSVTITEQD
jgi:type IV pilus assembly protein PilB